MKRSVAQQLIRERAVRSDHTILVPHVLIQMRESAVDFVDVQRCLRRGRAARGPYVTLNSITDAGRYDVEAIVDGEWLRVVVELPDQSSEVVVVTVLVVH